MTWRESSERCSHCFKSLLLKFFVGTDKRIPLLDPRFLFTGFFETVAIIISHAFVSHWPVSCQYMQGCSAPYADRDCLNRKHYGKLFETCDIDRSVVKLIIDEKKLKFVVVISFESLWLHVFTIS